MDDMRIESAETVFARLQAAGARIRFEDDRIKVQMPRGAMTDELAAAIKTHKAALIAIARRAEVATAETMTSTPVRRDDWGPLSALQERIWAHDLLEEKPGLYNLPAAWHVDGALDVSALIDAFDDVVTRHDAMRIVVRAEKGTPLQKAIDDPLNRDGAWRLMFEDMSSNPGTEEIVKRLDALAHEEIDLGQGPAYRAHLLRIADDNHILFFMPHHVIWDGISFDVFLADLVACYEARTSSAPSPLAAAPSFIAQAADERAGETANAADLAAAVEYWAESLTPTPKPIGLPTDKKRPQGYDFVGDWTTFQLANETLNEIKALAVKHRATPFMALYAIWRSFVARLAGNDDFVIGAPVLLRGGDGREAAIGCFANTLYLRTPVSFNDAVDAVIEAARMQLAAALPHGDTPVEALFERLEVDRDPGRPVLAQVMFSYQDASERPTRLGAARLSPIHLSARIATAELALSVTEEGDTARCDLIYAASLFSAEQAASIARSFETFLQAAIMDSTQILRDLPMAGEADIDRQKERDGATRRDFGAPLRVDQWITASAADRLDSEAVIADGKTTSYGALLDRAQSIAAALCDLGLGAGDIVGLMTTRSADMIAGVLALWRIGAAYLPLDPAYPRDRLHYMVEDSGARAILTERDTAKRVALDGTDTLNVFLDDISAETAIKKSSLDDGYNRPFDPSERAYVIYTSGSTGNPKGVENAHGPLFNFIASMTETPGFGAEDRLLAVTTLAFDISILEILSPLTAGGVVILADEEDAADPFALADLMDDARPSVMQATPSTWRLLLDGGWEGAPALKALCGGEPLPPALAKALKPKVGALWNMYGPTETTIWSACREITDVDDVTVGTPIANTTFYIVDAFGALTPDGVPGELFIGGAGVALGYLGRDALTAERFVSDPYSVTSNGLEGRLYRTGDLARRRHDGDYEILGRLDDQVKVRGHRIELGEIENALDQLPEITKVVAAVRRDAAGEPALVAFIKGAPGAAIVSSTLRRALRQRLPAYMLPQMFIEIDAVPMTNNGKINRNALPELAAAAGAPREHIAPRNDIEQAIADIWREMLPVETVSVTDNFFDLGGQSLLAARMAAIVKDRTGRRISPRSVIFETLEQLANASDAI